MSFRRGTSTNFNLRNLLSRFRRPDVIMCTDMRVQIADPGSQRLGRSILMLFIFYFYPAAQEIGSGDQTS